MSRGVTTASPSPDRRPKDAHSKQQQITQYAKDHVHHTALSLVGKAGIRKSDVEDIESDLLVEILERLPQFDPEKACYNTFVASVVRAKVKNILRDRQRERRDRSREEYSLNDTVHDGRGSRTEHAEQLSWEEDDHRIGGGRSEDEQREMTLDVETVLAGLSDDERALCELIKTESISEAARQLGIPQTTAASKVKRLRRVFREAGLEDYL